MGKIVTINVDFQKDYGIGRPEEYARDITLADTVIIKIAPVPADDDRLRLGLTHLGGFGSLQRELVLVDDATGDVVRNTRGEPVAAYGPQHAQSAFDLRMCTRLGRRGYDILLRAGHSYTITTKGWLGGGANPDTPCDFFLTVNT